VVLPVLQILGSVPATAFFPLIALLMLRLGLGMNVGSILLVLTGTFFYVMFNVLSGAAAIPRELNELAAALGIRGPRYVARVFLPAVLPSLVTGCVTAWGGGCNAIIFSEYMVAGGKRYEVKGIGAMLDRATYLTGDHQIIALSLLSMVALVVLVQELKARGFPLIDCQMHTPLLTSLGAREVPRRSFVRALTPLVNYPQPTGTWTRVTP
jgi:NitT/TauT family transport system permease protein